MNGLRKRHAPLRIGAAFFVFAVSSWAASRYVAEKAVPEDAGPRFEVRWNSMDGLLSSGREIRTASWRPARGDVVVLKTGVANPERVVKIVLAVEGDHFEYRYSNIYVNGELRKTSQGIPYRVDSAMLAQYSKEYPVLPKNALLLMGNVAWGSYDSSEFGLADISDVIGIVQNEKPNTIPGFLRSGN